MDSSDKEIIKDDLPEEETEMDEKHSQIKNEETCQDNELQFTTANPSVKRKFEQSFQNQRKRSTDNVRKESDDNLTDSSNIQDSDLAAGHSRKNEKLLSPVSLPCIRITSIEENSKQADQSITEEKNIKTSEESNPALRELKTSIMKYFSNVVDQSESDRAKISLLKNTVCEIGDNIVNILKSIKLIVNPENVTSDKPEDIIHSKNYEIYLSSKDDTKQIDENLLEKEQVADNEQSKLVVSEICAKCKQDGQLRPSISPGKRKSLDIVVEEIKLKRSANNAQIKVLKDENITDSSNVQDSALYTGHSLKRGKHLVNTVISTADKEQGFDKEQEIATNQTDQSAVKYKITETTDEAEYKTLKIQISKSENKPAQSSEILLLGDSIIRSTRNRSISFIERSFDRSLLDNVKECRINPPIKIGEDSSSEDALKDIKDIATESFSKLRDFPETPESKLQRKTEDISVKFPIKITNTNTKVSGYIPLNPSQNSADTTKSDDSNISKIREMRTSEETMPPEGIIGGNPCRRIPRFSPVKLFSDTECGLNPPYNEPESQNTNVEQMENDPEIVEQQKKILESIYMKRQQTSSIKPESHYEGKFVTPLSNKALALHEIQKRILGISNQRQQISSMKPKSDDEGKYPKPSELERPNEMSPEMSKRIFSIIQRLDGVFKSEGTNVRLIPTLTIISRLIELAEIYDPDTIPYIPCYIMKFQERRRQLQEENKTLYDKSTNESLEKNDRAINPIAFVDVSPDKNPLSPISSPPKSEPDKISETDSPEFREYPGLAEDPTNVKKDARYQKKFYKSKKPVTLPVNWSGDKASSSKIEPNIDSEDNKIQGIGNHPGIVSENDDGIRDEKSQENPKIILKNEDLLKEKSENTLLGQETASAKKDQRFYRLEPVLLPISWREDGGSSEMEPNIDTDMNEIQRIGDDQQIAFRNSEDTVHEESEKDPKTILLKDKGMFKETGKSPDDKPSGTSVSVSEYKTSLFTEGSPDSSQSNSPIRNNESTLQSVLEIIPQIELLAERSTSISSQISSSQARPSDSPDSQVRSSQSNKD